MIAVTMPPLPETPEKWREFHLKNVRSMDHVKVRAAVKCLQEWFANSPEREALEPSKAMAATDGEWWIGHHHLGMMGVRNYLRQNGFGEKFLGIDNLDDYGVGLVELAWGITTLEEKTMSVGSAGVDFTRAEALTPEVEAAIEDAFEHHAWTPEQVAKGAEIRSTLVAAVKAIIRNAPPCPDRSSAIRMLRQARMEANAAITLGRY